MNGGYKTNIDCSFIRGMVENYCTLGKIQSWPTIHLGLNFHHSPHEQWIFVYYKMVAAGKKADDLFYESRFSPTTQKWVIRWH